MRFLRSNFLPFAVLLALPVLVLLPALTPGHALLPAVMLGKMLPWQGTPAFPLPTDTPFNPLLFDGIAQFYPWRLFAARTWVSGYVPLWNPYQFCGTPFLANDQSATLYPPNLIFLMMPVARAFAASAVLHLFLTGAFLYAFLLRRVGVWPALFGAVNWQLSDWQVSWLALPTFLCTSAWIPLALLLVERSADAPSRIGRAICLGLCFGVMLLAGHLQIALYGLVVTAAYGLTLLFRSTNRNERWALAGSFALSAVVMLLLAAPQLLPTIELSRVSHRAGAHASLTGYARYVSLAMPWYRLVTLCSPSFYGRAFDYWGGASVPYSETACFLGVAGLLLACIGAVQAWRGKDVDAGRRARFFALAAIVAMLFALGTPINYLSYFGIPGFSQSGSPARVLVLWSLCGAVLSAYGLEHLLTRHAVALRLAVWTWAALLILPLVGAILFVQQQGQDYMRLIDRRDLLISAVIAVCALGLTALANTRRHAEFRLMPAVFIALAAVDLLRAGYGFNSVADLNQVYPTTPAIAFLQRNTAAKAGGNARIAALNASNGVYEQPGVLPPNAATVYELRDLQGYDSLQTGQYLAYLNLLNGNEDSSPQENGNMDLTHYKAAVSSKTAAETDAEWIISPVPLGSAAPALTDGQVSVYRQFAPTHGRVWTQSGGEGTETPALVIEDLPTRLIVEAQRSGDLMIADQYYPGWKASAVDKPLAVSAANGVFRTVRGINADERVEIVYAPTSFLLGLYLACAALLAAGMAAGYSIACNARRQPSTDAVNIAA